MVEVTKAVIEAASAVYSAILRDNPNLKSFSAIPIAWGIAAGRIAAEKAGHERGLREAAGIAREYGAGWFDHRTFDGQAIEAAILAKMETVDE